MDEQLGLAGALEEETSLVYIKQWDRLVSSTNWEKGRIINEWRTALVASHAGVTQYSDEAWSRRVGNVSSQHVGRLRRVFERFGEVQSSYEGLFWSHFQAALDWNDAEMWLEGAVQNEWSVAQMRSSRWLAAGAPDELRPRESDVIVAELDEDFSAPAEETGEASSQVARTSTPDGASGPNYSEGPDFGDEGGAAHDVEAFDPGAAEYPTGAGVTAARPFENLPALPPDLSEAFEQMKLAILRHKVSGWSEVSLDDVQAMLESLGAFAAAPS